MRRAIRKSGLLAVCSLFLALALPAVAGAHAQYKPFSTNRYTEVGFDEQGIVISYVTTFGDLPASELRQKADDDGDGVLSRAESEPIVAWLRGLLRRRLVVELDGKRVPVAAEKTGLELFTRRVELFAPIRIALRYSLPCEAGTHVLTYHDRSHLPALEQTEFYVRQGEYASVSALHRSGSQNPAARRVFWEEGKRPDKVRVRFALFGKAAGHNTVGARDSRLVDDTGPLKKALADSRLGFWGFLGVLGLAFALGAVHALSPGHGKALVAAYLIGTKGKMRHAVALGFVVTFTHVFSVFVMGLVALWASEKVMPERLAPWLSLAAGVIVALMGTWMIYKRRPGHTSHNHGHDHHHHDHDEAGGRVRLSELLLLGISGGMVPCLSAIVVLMFAIYLGRVAAGLVLILAFSLGLAATLIVLGVLVVRGRGLFEHLGHDRRGKWLLERLPLASAVVVSCLGIVMIVSAVMDI